MIGAVSVTQERPGTIIRRIRQEDVQLTQEQWAEHLGVGRTAVTQWETGASKPDPTNLAKILLQATAEHRQALLEALTEDTAIQSEEQAT